MTYQVKEIFYTLQGEGSHTGRPAVFCRFAGCNLWSGREQQRARAVCQFCDTDFVGTDGPGGGQFATAEELARAVANAWQGEPHPRSHRFVVCTGGEPLLQLDQPAVDALHSAGFEVTEGDELKLVFPQPGAEPERYEQLGFDRFRLQPMDGPAREANTRAAVAYCLAHPQWQLSLQTHKYLGIP